MPKPDVLDSDLFPMSNEAIERGSGKGWDAWLHLLDDWGAASKTHTEIARHVADDLGIPGWWAQAVTIGYERARGMREVHEKSDGFSANASKTFHVPLSDLYHAFTDPELQAKWLEPGTLRERKNTENKSARYDVLGGTSRLSVNFYDKGDRKSSAQLQEEPLGSAEDVQRSKAFWKEHLAKLDAVLKGES